MCLAQARSLRLPLLPHDTENTNDSHPNRADNRRLGLDGFDKCPGQKANNGNSYNQAKHRLKPTAHAPRLGA